MKTKSIPNLLRFSLFLVIVISIFINREALLKGKPDANTNTTNIPANIKPAIIQEERERWQKEIQKEGAETAYKKFKEEFSSRQYGEQHTVAHIIGELLYEKLGSKGFVVCDESFAYGCYHSFFGKAVATEGNSVLPIFHKGCIEKYSDLSLPCRHGIGHGIMSYVGNEKLLEALDLCFGLSQEPTGGCTSGVFMEYNFRTMEDPSGEKILTRKYDGNPFKPCNTLPDKFQQSCYFEQVQWWETVFSGDYGKIGELCDKLENQLNKQACFHGTGNYAAPFSGHDAGKTSLLCQKMPTPQGQAFCVEGASWIFLGMRKKDDARTLCQTLKDRFQKECLQKLEANPINKQG